VQQGDPAFGAGFAKALNSLKVFPDSEAQRFTQPRGRGEMKLKGRMKMTNTSLQEVKTRNIGGIEDHAKVLSRAQDST